MFISISSFAQDAQTMIQRVERDGVKPDNSRYYLYEDELQKKFSENLWKDEIVSIKEIWVEKPNNQSYYWAQIKTKNSGGAFYIHYDPFWAENGNAFLAIEPSLYPQKFKQHIADVIAKREADVKSRERAEALELDSLRKKGIEEGIIKKLANIKRTNSYIDSLMRLDGLVIASDFDGNEYRNLKFGDQVWMVENLKTTKYSNGKPIPNIVGDNWDMLKSGAYCWLKNDPSQKNNDLKALSLQSWKDNRVMGALYNFYAIIDTNNICPKGWHVPNIDEWKKLIDYYGGNTEALDKMTFDVSGMFSDKNTSYFTAVNGGTYGKGSFIPVTAYWTSTTSGEDAAMVQFFNYDKIEQLAYYKSVGVSVRCIKDDALYLENKVLLRKNKALLHSYKQLFQVEQLLIAKYDSLKNQFNSKIENEFCLNTSNGIIIKECFEKNNQNVFNAFQLLYMEYLKNEKANLDEKNEFFNMYPGLSIQQEDDNLLEKEIFPLDYEDQINKKLALLNSDISFYKKGIQLTNEFEQIIHKFKEVLSSADLKNTNKSLKGITDIKEIKSLIGLQ